jgi:hypothetical protein
VAIRDLGNRAANFVLDGVSTVISSVDTVRSTVSNITRGFARPLTSTGATTEVNAADNIDSQGNSRVVTPKNKLSAQGNKLVSVIPNPLEQYASFSPLWTLACLETAEYNKPQSYRKTGKLKHIVFSSAGRYDRDRVGIAGGDKPEFYVDNFRMAALVAPNQKSGNTNAIKIEFDVFEPYSMGLFLQSLQVAAQRANYTNYLVAPYVLRLDFLGFNDQQQILTPINAGFVRSKYFVIKIIKATFNVDASGSNYQVEAIPFNHQSFNDSATTLYNDIKIIPDNEGTVEEALRTGENSLVAALNRIETGLVDAGKISVPDIYDIQFPISAEEFATFDSGSSNSSTSATSDPDAPAEKVVGGETIADLPPSEANDIGRSSYGFDESDGGGFPFAKETAQRDPDTGVVKVDNVTIDPKARTFQFAQGQSIINIITTMILNSEYVFNALKPENKKDGLIRHFMIDIQTEFLALDVKTGEHAMKTTYRVVPYFVHESVFINPNATPPGYPEIEKKISKAYNYVYTGENTDILKFDIQINNLFYVGIKPSGEARGKSAVNNDASGTAERTQENVSTGVGNSPAAQLTNVGRPRAFYDPDTIKDQNAGGSGDKSIEDQVAEQFHSAFIKGTSSDLVKVDLEILGDPYWLIDHGIANHFAATDDPEGQITSEGSLNYTNGTTYIYIKFRTPSDVDDVGGLYKYSQSMIDSPFSGIYRVIRCESIFNGGVFTQQLECLRMIGQSLDFQGNNQALQQQTVTNTDNSVVETDETLDTRSAPNQDPINAKPSPSVNAAADSNAAAQAATTEGNVTRIDISSQQREARNAAIRDVLARGGSIQEAESAGQVAGNLAGVRAFQSLETTSTTTTTGGGVTVRTAEPQVTGRAIQRRED